MLCLLYLDMQINSLVVRRALAPEGVSLAESWILVDPDDNFIIKAKQKLEARDDNALKTTKMQAPSVDTEVTRDVMMSGNMQDTTSTASSDEKIDFKEVIAQQTGESK